MRITQWICLEDTPHQGTTPGRGTLTVGVCAAGAGRLRGEVRGHGEDLRKAGRGIGAAVENTVKWVVLYSDSRLRNWTTVGQNKTLLSAIWEEGLLIGDIS